MNKLLRSSVVLSLHTFTVNQLHIIIYQRTNWLP